MYHELFTRTRSKDGPYTIAFNCYSLIIDTLTMFSGWWFYINYNNTQIWECFVLLYFRKCLAIGTDIENSPVVLFHNKPDMYYTLPKSQLDARGSIVFIEKLS